MSPYGYERTSSRSKSTSAPPPKPDIPGEAGLSLMSCVLEHLTTLFMCTRPSQTSSLRGIVVTPEGLEGGANLRRDSEALGD
jgi:hypothetical protein